MKNLILLLFLSFAFISCEKESCWVFLIEDTRCNGTRTRMEEKCGLTEKQADKVVKDMTIEGSWHHDYGGSCYIKTSVIKIKK